MSLGEEEIISLITNSLMRSCKSEPCLLPILRAFGLLGKGTLQALDFLDGAFQVFVVLYLRTVRKSGKRLDAQIYSDNALFSLIGLGVASTSFTSTSMEI